MKTLTTILLLLFFYCCTALCQPNGIFRGGAGGGNSLDSQSFTSDFNKGDSGGGSTEIALFFINPYYQSIENGIHGGGSTQSSIVFSNAYYQSTSNGVNGEGFLSGFQDIYYKGGLNQDVVTLEWMSTYLYYLGGENGGNTSLLHFASAYWTGLDGTGWLVENNWAHQLIPDHNRKAIIPPGVPNFPFVNTGLLHIGSENILADYSCKSLEVWEGAEMTTRVNCIVENRGNILIQGSMLTKNPSPSSFTNFSLGKVTIGTLGNWTFME